MELCPNCISPSLMATPVYHVLDGALVRIGFSVSCSHCGTSFLWDQLSDRAVLEQTYFLDLMDL